MKIHISFTDDEIDLYTWFKKKRGRSAMIKDLLEEAKRKEERKESPALNKSPRLLKF